MPTTGRQGQVLARLVAHIMSSGDPLERDLPPDWVPTQAAATYFLLHQAGPNGIDPVSLVCDRLDRLLASLIRSTQHERNTHRGRVRGRIDWSATWKARLADDDDPTRFVCLEVRRHYNTPENQLLKYLVDAIWSALEAIPPTMREGVCCLPMTEGDAIRETIPTSERLAVLETRLIRARQHPLLREIAIPESITEHHLARAETAKLDEYANLVALYRTYHDSVLSPRSRTLAALARTLLPLPERADRTGEPWIRLAAALLRRSAAAGAGRQTRI